MARFQLPITEFIETKIRENFANFDLREGTAFRDMLIKPMSILIQPLRDQSNIIRRNLSLGNFPLMLEDEFDALVSNVFVDRRTGAQATGQVRIFFDTPSDVIINTDVKFLTEDAVSFIVQDPVVITAEQMRFNQEGLLFFIDADVISEESFGDTVPIGGIIFIEGAPANAVSVTNKTAITAGTARETNTELFARAQTSIATRNLVTEKSISATLQDQFTAIREVIVIGFGDPEMNRDIQSVAFDVGVVIGERSTGAITVPKTFDDTSGIDFIQSKVAAGHTVEVLTGPNTGSFVITKVVTATRLEVAPDFTINETSVNYKLCGFFIKADVHVGGKVDIYHDTTSRASKSITIDPIPVSKNVFVNRDVLDGSIQGGGDKLTTTTFDFILEEVSIADQVEILNGADAGIFEIDAVSAKELTLDTTGFLEANAVVEFRIIRAHYSGGTLFTTPILKATRVIRLDPITFEELGSPLGDNADFFLRVDDVDLRYSSVEDVHFEFDPTFIGTTMKIEYTTDDTIGSVQAFIETRENRVKTADLLAKHAIPAFTDVTLSYRGSLAEETAEQAITDFIDTIPFLETLQQSDIVAHLYAFDANFIPVAFTVTVTVINADATISTLTGDNVKIPNLAQFIPQTIAATKLGA